MAAIRRQFSWHSIIQLLKDIYLDSLVSVLELTLMTVMVIEDSSHCHNETMWGKMSHI